ncbi:Hypothetical predicted protein, partial [Paramuricea clavata]
MIFCNLLYPAPTPSTDCKGKNWQKGPGTLCFQINHVPKTWEDARSTCLDRGGDLLSITTEEESKAIAEKIKYGMDDYFWISLNDRDYRGIHYWSNNEAFGLINWGSGAPEHYNEHYPEDTNEGITFNDTWLEDNSNTQMVFDDSDNDQTSDGSENIVDCNAESLNCDTECKTQQSFACDDDEHRSEDEAEIPAGVTDTVLTSPDFVTDNERQHILNVAP